MKLKNIKRAGIRGIMYDLVIDGKKLVAKKMEEKINGDVLVVMDGDKIQHDNKQYVCRLTEKTDCSIKKIEFIPA